MKPIEGFPGYFINEAGEVFSKMNRKPILNLKLTISKKGYLKVGLYRGGKCFNLFVHRLVLSNFVGPQPDGEQCAHLNGNCRDNRVENLAWVTPTENNFHRRAHGTHMAGQNHPQAKLSSDQVFHLRSLREIKTLHELAAIFSITASQVRRILNSDAWLVDDGIDLAEGRAHRLSPKEALGAADREGLESSKDKG